MKPAKLFHAIVVLGASVTGCGDEDRVPIDSGAMADASAAVDAGMSEDAAMGDDAAMGEDAGEEEDAFVAIL